MAELTRLPLCARLCNGVRGPRPRAVCATKVGATTEIAGGEPLRFFAPWRAINHRADRMWSTASNAPPVFAEKFDSSL